MTRHPTRDENLRTVAVHAVRMYIEVEAGRRSPATMTRLARPAATEEIHAVAGRARNTQTASIHRITLQRPTPDRADIAALIRQPDATITAVTMHLHQVGQRWQITDIAHLDRGQNRTHAQQTAGDLPPTLERAARRFDIAALLGAANAADHEARTAATPDDAANARTRATAWRRRADQLTHALGEPPPPAQSHNRSDRQRPAGFHHQEALLGPKPADGAARELWSVAAGLLDGYRSRWNISDPITPLGPVPPHGDQRDDRQATLRRISRVVRDLTRVQERDTPRTPTRERHSELGGP